MPRFVLSSIIFNIIFFFFIMMYLHSFILSTCTLYKYDKNKMMNDYIGFIITTSLQTLMILPVRVPLEAGLTWTDCRKFPFRRGCRSARVLWSTPPGEGEARLEWYSLSAM